jgi:hypothetical protein
MDGQFALEVSGDFGFGNLDRSFEGSGFGNLHITALPKPGLDGSLNHENVTTTDFARNRNLSTDDQFSGLAGCPGFAATGSTRLRVLAVQTPAMKVGLAASAQGETGGGWGWWFSGSGGHGFPRPDPASAAWASLMDRL